ncbi:nitroreductase family protein [Nocardia sp. CA2R105]|uniref:nitroreductase family protein n=1 Tax=Nocardia coffeae TaxID=2873381 RepID=UPI001CA6B660|nr:nitroreductase family protein [Nocardia coffeae]MBY8860866.1 nitroreductase family protein [Nocardia coffeae]
MTDLLPLTPDALLTTTRAVRRRLDLTRPVPLEVIRAALEVALQAPSGGNQQRWHWIVLTDPAIKAKVAEHYRRSHLAYREAGGEPADESAARIATSSDYLREVMAEVPALVIGAIDTGSDAELGGNQAGLWGSLLPAAWSLALALRARGLGTTWTTLHLQYEREVAEVLGIPDTVRQGVLLPVAYTKGTDFRPGPRVDLDSVLHIDGW